MTTMLKTMLFKLRPLLEAVLFDRDKKIEDIPEDTFFAVSRLSDWIDTQVPMDGKDEQAVLEFSVAMNEEMEWQSEENGKHGWDDPKICSEEDLVRMFVEHIPKGDVVDIANYFMMLYHRDVKPETIRGIFKRMYPHSRRDQRLRNPEYKTRYLATSTIPERGTVIDPVSMRKQHSIHVDLSTDIGFSELPPGVGKTGTTHRTLGTIR